MIVFFCWRAEAVVPFRVGDADLTTSTTMAVDDKSPLPGSGHRVSKVEPHAERETLPCDRDEHPPVHEAAPQSRQQSHHQNDAAVRYGEDVNDGPCTAVEWNRASERE
ncbi:hypothetical protein MRX96_030859 [Rhipicephalus microplus]